MILAQDESYLHAASLLYSLVTLLRGSGKLRCSVTEMHVDIGHCLGLVRACLVTLRTHESGVNFSNMIMCTGIRDFMGVGGRRGGLTACMSCNFAHSLA